MSETVWVALLTGMFTLASGVIGVMLTHRYSRTQAEAARREDRRRDARTLLAQYVEAGTQWANTNRTMVPIWHMNSQNQQFWREWSDTDSARSIREYAEAITRSGGELRLIVGDEELLRRITAAQAKMSDNAPMLALIDASKRAEEGKGAAQALNKTWDHYIDVIEAFRAVEGRAAELLRGNL